MPLLAVLLHGDGKRLPFLALPLLLCQRMNAFARGAAAAR